jgi:hypothetical protein
MTRGVKTMPKGKKNTSKTPAAAPSAIPPLPSTSNPTDRLPEDLETLWKRLEQLAASMTPDAREQAYKAERTEADRQLETLAAQVQEEHEYNLEFRRVHGYWPDFRNRKERWHPGAVVPVPKGK